MNLALSDYHTLLRGDLTAFIQRTFQQLNPTATFLPNWHIEVVSSALEACRRGEITRLIINQPPRSLKSHCASVAFTAFLLGMTQVLKSSARATARTSLTNMPWTVALLWPAPGIRPCSLTRDCHLGVRRSRSS